MPVADDGRRASVDLPSLKALAHPLRVALLHALTTHGAQTASALGARLGESSGSTSYHLRQLERAGFVREVEGRGTARERWWERAVGDVDVWTPELAAMQEGRAAAAAVLGAWSAEGTRLLQEFIDHGEDDFAPEVNDAARVATLHGHLAVDELRALTRDVEALIAERLAASRTHEGDEDALRVLVQLHAFPVADRAPAASPARDAPTRGAP
ncbi:ArsR/SmtB family transcription factor [Agrococcus jejuensis]|uniref:Helix-turn-helix domain-containing protein n=1 Tax=Agrococcus jejuensis TaxID=399736 RepID=A0A1G8GTS3_9MICO|nr:helix-turn-helix domain-containing protein [Agrococcus jejuensis]SDH97787.1 Helix-turn-helix domain-containing protein [Agrococcus jejuensis]